MQDLSLAESWEYLTDKLTRLIEENVPEGKISPVTAETLRQSSKFGRDQGKAQKMDQV